MKKIKEFILNHKKLSIIIAALIIVLIIIIICIFCFGGNNEPVETKEDKLSKHAEAQAFSYIALRYDTTYIDTQITNIDELGDGNWEVYGKIYVRDNYNDNYSGTFSGTCVEVIENGEEDFDCDLEYSSITKSR